MRFYTQLHTHISKQAPLLLPKAMREQLDAVLTSLGPALSGLVRLTIQRTGASAVDQAIEILGLGRHGVRLTGSSLSTSAQRWEAELTAWSAASVAEATEILVRRALAPFFDLSGGEHAAIDSMSTRWLQESRGSHVRGSMVLEWPIADREVFRRRVLEHLANGTTTELTLAGFDLSGLVVVEVEVTVFARARAQLKGNL